MGTVVAVNVGVVEQFEHQGRAGETAIRKSPVDGSVLLDVGGPAGAAGDEIANTANHGGSLRAVYAYAGEDVTWWERQLDRTLPPGSFGENLTLDGIDVTGARPGDRWRVGEALLEVTVIRTPCWKLAWALGEEGIERAFQRAARPGAYLSVVEPGEVAAGDDVRVVRERVDLEVTMGSLAVAYHVDRRQRQQVLEDADLLPPDVARWVRDEFG